ncbi:hypothetical protein GCM10009801_45810 [Streptomyces albiaxialis]|uniref:Uncharacterized protein n=1 Tax=Streptomyces albiaxialis TaxID=329523 RepID=A0ABN2W5W9_9ACTN
MRYRPARDANRLAWHVLDLRAGEFCTLPGQPWPLTWPDEQGANAWLAWCYQAWTNGTAPAPDGWEPSDVGPSPFAPELRPS